MSVSLLCIYCCVSVLTVHLLLCQCPYYTSTAVSVSLLYIHCCVSVFTVHVSVSLLYIHCGVTVLTVHPLRCHCPYCTSTAVSLSLLYIHCCVTVLTVHPLTVHVQRPVCPASYCVSVPHVHPSPGGGLVGPSGFRAAPLKMDRVLDRQQRSYPVRCFTPPFGLTHFRETA